MQAEGGSLRVLGGWLTQGLHDHAGNHFFQDFTVGVQGGVGVHFQQPHLGPTLLSIPPHLPLGQEKAETLVPIKPRDHQRSPLFHDLTPSIAQGAETLEGLRVWP